MILVFGKTGQVATELAALPDVLCLGREAADLTDPATCAAALRHYAPDAVINAAAYTDVDRAEKDAAAAMAVNGTAPAAMAVTCAELTIPLVHISSDYVFDGSGSTPWPTDAPTGPLGAYGRSKLAGEQGVTAAGARAVILRTSWVFSAQGANFVKTMLALSETRQALSIVHDQLGGPTSARAIAQACHQIAARLIAGEGPAGIYHFAGAPDVSWADFATEIFAQAGRQVRITRIPSSDYPTAAKRPLNSRLDCHTTLRAFGIDRPDWRLDLAETIHDLEVN